MFIIVVGVGDIGYYLAQLLLEEDHDLILIDRDEAVCKKVSDELDIVVNKGDATDPKVLEKANVKEADALVSLTGSDETNMIVSLLAKELGAKNVATRIGRVEYDENVLKKLGIDIVIHPEAAAAGYIAELITKPEVLDLAFISRGQAEILELQVLPTSKAVGKKVKEIEHPAGSAIVALFEGDNIIIPDPEKVIEAGMKVLVLTKNESIEKVRKMFT